MDISRKLRKSDNNKAQGGQIILDFQGRTEKGDGTDNAEERLFVQVDKSLLKRPSYRQFLALTDNFSREPGVAEPRVSAEEEGREMDAFLTTVLQSKPFQILYDLLHKKGHPYAVDPETFRKMVTQLWFGHYSRSHGPPDTSGFEHVFIGENTVAVIKFAWGDYLKPIGSFIIGTSPEFEMALFTLCFLSRRGRAQCQVDLDGCPLQVVSHDFIQNDKVFIGTTYPKAGPNFMRCAAGKQDSGSENEQRRVDDKMSERIVRSGAGPFRTLDFTVFMVLCLALVSR